MAGPSYFELVMANVASLVYGFLFLLDALRQTIRHGYSAVWGSKTFSRPACIDDPGLGCHSYIILNGLKIHYVASGPEDKPLMLFLHGFPEFWFSWRHQIREFQKDYRVVAIDHRGYGDSDKPEGVDSYDVSCLLGDVRGVISGLGYKSCVLVAHDWGGALAWAFASHFPDMVDKLVVMNAPSKNSFEKMLKTHKAQQKMSWYIFFFQLPFLPELSMRMRQFRVFDKIAEPFKNKMTDDELNAYKYTFSQSGALTPPINWYRAALRPSVRSYDMNYQMPVLLVWGVKDMALHIDLVACMEQECPQMEVRRISDAGHFVQMEAPGEVNKAMRDWLDSTG